MTSNEYTHPIGAFRPLGVVAVAILAAALVVLVRVWPQGAHKTFSQHAAAHRQAIVYYIALFSVVLPLLLLFFIGWFVPALHVSRWLSVLIAASVAMQYGAALIPEVGGWKSSCHRALTLGSAALLPPSLLLITLATHGIDKLVSAIGTAAISALLAVALTFRDGHRYTLLLQSSYYIVFFATVLWVAYS